MERTRYRYVLAAALTASGACVGPLEPEGARLKDPGTVEVSVRDAAGSPMSGVWVYVELPNNIGSTFWEGTATRGEGKVTFHYVPAGTHTVEVKPPAGSVAEEGAKRDVVVVKGRTASTHFTLRRN